MMDDPRPGAVPDVSTAAAVEAPQVGAAVRTLESLADFHECVALQDAVWGPDFRDTVPASLLRVATYVGGLAIGAFDSSGRLLGFVFGLTGVQDGRIVHWSHLLGVRDSARNLGLGRTLKEFQRAELARRGIPEMRWTFDPLIAKNAHLNLNLLGARVVRYVPDMYGTTASPLHHGLATDRLVVACPTADAGAPRAALTDDGDAPVLTLVPGPDDTLVDMRGDRPGRIRIEVPTEFQQLSARSAALAAEWHAAVRRHFVWALHNDYVVTGVQRDAVTSRTFYVLAAASPLP